MVLKDKHNVHTDGNNVGDRRHLLVCSYQVVKLRPLCYSTGFFYICIYTTDDLCVDVILGSWMVHCTVIMSSVFINVVVLLHTKVLSHNDQMVNYLSCCTKSLRYIW